MGHLTWLSFVFAVALIFPAQIRATMPLQTNGTDYVVYDPGTPPFPDTSTETLAGNLKSVNVAMSIFMTIMN